MLSAEEVAAVDAALGTKGSAVADELLYTVPLPRNDLSVTIQGDPVPVPFGFGGWASFKKARDGRTTMAMGDTVLVQEEVNPVITAAQAGQVQVTAIHNHFFWEEPRIFFMHLHAMGEDVGELAQRYSAAILPSRLHPKNQPPPKPFTGAGASERFALPELDGIVGSKGAVNGPVYKYTIGRPDLTVVAMDTVISAAIGMNSWAAFAGDMKRAHVAGDIAMLEAEVNPVIAALRRNNLDVVAVHNHMLGERPRIIFLHYYGTGAAPALARGFRAALDELGGHGKAMAAG
ncbi:MAG: DUF1259 domain-containing protein [Armatimonadota bacterium]